MSVRILSFFFIAAACRAQAWQPIPAPTTASLRGLRAVSSDVVWASGTGGTVIRTIDGGKNWVVLPVAGAGALDFRGVWAWDENAAFVMSSGKAEDGYARVYKTDNGGKDWSLVLEQNTPGVFFDAIAFWDKEHGIVLSDPVGGSFRIFLTDDGGNAWRQVTAPSLTGEGAFAASNSCLAVNGERNAWFGTGGAKVARVFRSSDRGQTWTAVETPIRPLNSSSGIFSLAFLDGRHGLAVGGDYAVPIGTPLPNAISTSDGGKTWHAKKIAPIYLSSVVHRPRSKQPIGAGSAGVVTGTKISARNVNALSFSPHDLRGWAVGPGGRVFREQVAKSK